MYVHTLLVTRALRKIIPSSGFPGKGGDITVSCITSSASCKHTRADNAALYRRIVPIVGQPRPNSAQ